MNYLVFLDTHAGELEKILSGMKTMLIKENDPAQSTAQPVNPGDSLYFLKDQNDCDLRVKATVVRILVFPNHLSEGLSQILKEMQPRLQLTEEQYNFWSTKRQVVLVEFEAAQKIGVIHMAPGNITNRSGWIPFDAFNVVNERRS